MTIFDRIIAREIPAQIVHETDELIAFHDVRPQAPVHVLIVPKRCIVGLGEATGNDAEVLGRLEERAEAVGPGPPDVGRRAKVVGAGGQVGEGGVVDGPPG